jgi:hypothetical protein
MRKYKTTGNTTLFDKEDKERKLSEMGDPLERLSQVIDFEMFRSELEEALLPKESKSNAGAKRYDVVMMFKLMVLQRYYNLSNEQTEYQIVDRTSFRRFLGLAEGDRVPDARTIWLFRERLAKSGEVGILFQKYRMKDEICEKGYRGHPLTEEQKESNRKKSKTRCRVEHIFGFMENTMHRLYIRTVGLARATAVIGLINLTYNMSRYEQIVRLKLLQDQ